MMCLTGTDVEHAARLLRDGGLVAFPTETVYGLGANALSATAVARVFEAKERPRFDPLIVHVHEAAQIERLAPGVPDQARVLIERFWPGPLTLVLPKTDLVPDLVTSALPTVALRSPDHAIALELLRRAGVPVAAPSANLFGRLSPTEAAHVAEQLGDRIDYILDGGPCRVGVESTVLDVSREPATLLRPGGLPLEEIEAVIGPVALGDGREPGESGGRPTPSPGMLPHHYAPTTPLLVVAEIAADVQKLAAAVSPGHAGGAPRVGLLSLTPEDPSRFAAVETLSPTGDLREAAAGFFAALRRLDQQQLELMIARPFPEEGLGRALNDRLRRAAAAHTEL
ncbi:MAG TPA: L-threonylcarbamoyladenylate synthase [Planctomycetaceae bacterium]|nr:L-threonylcarbamoyladenylate synthase [Planctomycetaceae bacterium]